MKELTVETTVKWTATCTKILFNLLPFIPTIQKAQQAILSTSGIAAVEFPFDDYADMKFVYDGEERDDPSTSEINWDTTGITVRQSSQGFNIRFNWLSKYSDDTMRAEYYISGDEWKQLQNAASGSVTAVSLLLEADSIAIDDWFCRYFSVEPDAVDVAKAFVAAKDEAGRQAVLSESGDVVVLSLGVEHAPQDITLLELAEASVSQVNGGHTAEVTTVLNTDKQGQTTLQFFKVRPI